MQGIIIKGISSFYYVKVENSIYECKARGIFRKDCIIPFVGDICTIDVLDEDKKIGNIIKLRERKNYLMRPTIANIDKVAIVSAVAHPDPVPLLLDKMVIIAEAKGITPFIIFNKIDKKHDEALINSISQGYKSAGYKVFNISATRDIELDEIKEYLHGGVTAFAGCSGVGKSSILNLLNPKTILATSAVSEKIKRGRHTTRSVELYEVDGGGFIADTPGFSTLEVTDLNATMLEVYYPEFEPYIGNCKFRGCHHINEPECAVKNAVEEGIISPLRYANYSEFYNTLKDIKEWER